MAYKEFEHPSVGRFTVYKRRGTRHMKLSVTANGSIRVSLPPWAPYRLGIEFATQKADWIRSQQRPTITYVDGQAIGKAHRLRLLPTAGISRPSTRVTDIEVRVKYPPSLKPTDDMVQLAIAKASVRALRKQAEILLPQRLSYLAKKHGFDFHSVSVKPLKSRWGSCNEKKDIILNCYLMQLPWSEIDYVLLHELQHTKIMAHGKPFWQALGQHVNDLPAMRRQMRLHRPQLLGG
jgi:predicted metal-dependent hydrolase